MVIPSLELLRGTSAIRRCVGFFMGNSLSDLRDLLIAFTEMARRLISTGRSVGRFKEDHRHADSIGWHRPW